MGVIITAGAAAASSSDGDNYVGYYGGNRDRGYYGRGRGYRTGYIGRNPVYYGSFPGGGFTVIEGSGLPGSGLAGVAVGSARMFNPFSLFGGIGAGAAVGAGSGFGLFNMF